MNPLYNQLMGQNMPQQRSVQQIPNLINPFQRMGQIMQAMRNPAAFVKQMIPDLPDNIANNPNQILQYLKQTRGVTDQQIQQITGQMPRF